jgi:hypothetical protein
MSNENETVKVRESNGQFKKGSKRPEGAGRKKGTPNKRTADIVERLKGVDIVGELLEIARTTEKEDTKVTVYKELMKYVYPQRKAVEIANEIELPPIKIEGVKI